MIFPINTVEPLVNINPFSPESLGNALFFISSGNGLQQVVGSGVVFPVANAAYLIPFVITKTIQVKNLFVMNGNVVSGNVDVGIYDASGNKLVSSGSTAQAGTSVLQTFSVTTTQLAPGQYYLAVAMDNTTGKIANCSGASSAARYDQTLGLAKVASSFPLPSTLTLASLGEDFIPLIGLSTRSVV